MGIIGGLLDAGASQFLAETADTAANAYRRRFGVGVFDQERNREIARKLVSQADIELEASECLAEVIQARSLLTWDEETELNRIMRKLKGFHDSLTERCDMAMRVGEKDTIDADDMKEIGACFELFEWYLTKLEDLVEKIGNLGEES